MKHIYKLLLALIMCAIAFPAHAELLVVKKGADGFFAPLTQEDIQKSGKIISDILLKYQWPTCVAALNEADIVLQESLGKLRIEQRKALSAEQKLLLKNQRNALEAEQKILAQEQDALLTAGKAYAEEQFIQEKIQAALGKHYGKEYGDAYGVIFVPTALYELFLLIQLFDMQKNPFDEAQKKFLASDDAIKKLDLTDILNKTGEPGPIRREIYARYNAANNIFFEEDVSAVTYINKIFVEWLYAWDSMLAHHEDSLALSEALHKQSSALSAQLIATYVGKYPKELMFHSMAYLIAGLKQEHNNKIVAQIVALEYEARTLNKALLIRGTTFEKLQVGGDGQPVRATLAGTTVRGGKLGIIGRQSKAITESSSSKRKSGQKEIEPSFEQIYKQKLMRPHSISFGNSLFAGALFDRAACAYNYLLSTYRTGEQALKPLGYALFIDKKAYIEHQVNNLFFIAPLSPLTALFEKKSISIRG